MTLVCRRGGDAFRHFGLTVEAMVAWGLQAIEKTMTIKVAISGYGRIGRCVLRAIVESPRASLFQVVAINDTAGIATTAHLTQFDSTHGRFPKPIRVEGQHLWVGDRQILVISDRDPKNLPWKALDVDLVFECTGHFTDRESASQHLAAGAKKVLISAPGKGLTRFIVYGLTKTRCAPPIALSPMRPARPIASRL